MRMCNIKQTFLSHFSIITNIKMKLFLPTHRLVVTATDRGSPRLAGSATLTVIIVDQNDNSPTIPLHQEVRIPESKYIHLPECCFFLPCIYRYIQFTNCVTRQTLCVVVHQKPFSRFRHVDRHRDHSRDG